MSTVTSYAKQFIAIVKGDKNEVIAAQNERKATAAYKGQLSALEGKLVDAEIEVQNRKDNLKNAILSVDSEGNGRAIGDSSSYIQSVASASSYLATAEKSLADYKKSYDTYKGIMAEYGLG